MSCGPGGLSLKDHSIETELDRDVSGISEKEKAIKEKGAGDSGVASEAENIQTGLSQIQRLPH